MTGLAGRASPEGTRQFAARAVRDRKLPLQHFRHAPGDLTLSSLGLGTYIGPADGPTDLAVEQAVAVCLSSGRVNVVDTAINYRYQRAERCVGRTLARLVERGELGREEVFVATKNGYLAPDSESPIPLERWVADELVAPGILEPRDIVEGSHAMSLPYLEDQFERSRENLRLETIDLLYLHNAPDAQLAAVGRPEFLRRLEAAFRLYEKFRAEGTLGGYGLATWDCLRVPPGTAGHFDLSDAVRVAERAGGPGHGLRFVQFPFNLSMPEAAAWPTQVVEGRTLPLFEAASHFGLGCFTSVPLLQGQLSRRGPRRDGLSTAQTALQFCRSAPGSLAPLIGQKKAEHLSENLALAAHAPWGPDAFRALLK